MTSHYLSIVITPLSASFCKYILVVAFDKEMQILSDVNEAVSSRMRRGTRYKFRDWGKVAI